MKDTSTISIMEFSTDFLKKRKKEKKTDVEEEEEEEKKL